MEYNDYMNALMVLFTQMLLGSYVFMLTEFKEPVRVWRSLWAAVIIPVVCANILLILFFDFWDIYKRVGIVTVTLPYVFMTLLCSRYKGLRVVFNICTCLWLGCIGNANGILAHALMPENVWLHVAVRIASYLALYFVVRFFKPYYKRMLQLLDKGWGTLCLIPSAAFILTLYLINNFLQDDPLAASVIIYGIVIVCTCSYVLIYLFFMRVLQEYDLKNSRELVEAQIAALERQSESNHELDEKMRIQRHDMRHQWMTVSALIEQGDKQAVLGFIDTVRSRIDDADQER